VHAFAIAGPSWTLLERSLSRFIVENLVQRLGVTGSLFGFTHHWGDACAAWVVVVPGVGCESSLHFGVLVRLGALYASGNARRCAVECTRSRGKAHTFRGPAVGDQAACTRNVCRSARLQVPYADSLPAKAFGRHERLVIGSFRPCAVWQSGSLGRCFRESSLLAPLRHLLCIEASAYSFGLDV